MATHIVVPDTSITVTRFTGPARPDGSERTMIQLTQGGHAISLRGQAVWGLIAALAAAGRGEEGY